jgi:hypothetical protein
MAKTNRKKDMPKKGRFKGAARASQQLIKMQVVKLIEDLPIDPRTGKPKHGAIFELINEQKQVYPWLTRDVVNKARKRYKKKPPSASDQTRIEPSSASDDAPAPGDAAENNGQPKKAGRPKGTTENNGQPKKAGRPKGTTKDNGQPKKVGRPKGTTDTDKRVQNQREKALIDEISHEYADAKKKAGDKKLEPKTLGQIIQMCKSKHDLKYFEVAEETIRSRYKRGNLSNVIRGSEGPLASIEPLIVEFVKASNRAGAPLTKTAIIDFANSLIKDGPMAEQVAEFKRKHICAYATDNHDGICEVDRVGNGWYSRFCKRWSHELGSGTKDYRSDICEVDHVGNGKRWSHELGLGIKDYRSSDIGAYKKGVNVRDTLAESDWLSSHYKIMIQFKRLRMHQDHAMTLELTNDMNGRNNKMKDKQPRLKLQAIPSKIDGRKAVWEKCRKLSDPDMPASPEVYASDDENDIGRFSSADESSVHDEYGGRFSSDASSVDDGRFSSDASSVDDNEDGGRFSSDASSIDDDRFSSADASSVDDNDGGRFSSDASGVNDGRFSSDAGRSLLQCRKQF